MRRSIDQFRSAIARRRFLVLVRHRLVRVHVHGFVVGVILVVIFELVVRIVQRHLFEFVRFTVVVDDVRGIELP